MTKQQSGKDNVEAPVTATELSEAELEKAAGGLNFTKIEMSYSPLDVKGTTAPTPPGK
jgi:hypothetical protein